MAIAHCALSISPSSRYLNELDLRDKRRFPKMDLPLPCFRFFLSFFLFSFTSFFPLSFLFFLSFFSFLSFLFFIPLTLDPFLFHSFSFFLSFFNFIPLFFVSFSLFLFISSHSLLLFDLFHLFVAGNATYKSPCRSVRLSEGRSATIFALLHY